MCAAVHMLRASPEYKRVSKDGARWVTPGFIVQVLETGQGHPLRLGLTASRKVGNAVRRNRARRRLREMVRTFPRPLPEGIDMVLIARQEAAARDFAQMQKDLGWALRRLGVVPR